MRFRGLACKGRSSHGRWIVYPTWNYPVAHRFFNGEPIRDWNESKAVYATSHWAGSIEDVPWCRDGNLLVSARLREFLEAEAPGDAQYLPARILAPGHEEDGMAYLAVNMLRMFDCLDVVRSMNESDDEEHPFVEELVIDPSWIPPDGVIGRVVGHALTTLVRDDLAEKIEALGFTGPQFYDVWHSDDEGAPPPIWRPGVRRP